MALDASLQAIATVAAAAGISQIAARRLPIPVPVILLGIGLLAGPDGLGVIDPHAVENLVEVAVVLSVALIVFEGGTALNWRLLRVMGPVVRNMVGLGLIITPLLGMLAAHLILGFPWRVSALLGALVCVTGPSVITPLLRAVRVNDRMRVTLMGEGIIIDPFGALLTLFLLQLAVSESIDPAGPTMWVVQRVATGIVLGAVGALVVMAIPQVVKRLSAREVSLMVVGAGVVVFAASETIAHEAGLAAMVVMGIALGNLPLPHRDALNHFQEHIVAFLVSAVYVLLAAEIDVHELVRVAPKGLLLAGALAFVARPILVAIATYGSVLSWRERAFLALVGPRGVVAASLAGVVALEAGGRLGADEAEFVSVVFIVILSTILVQSTYAGPLARYLKVQPLTTVIAGAGESGRRLAGKLTANGEEVLLIEENEAAAVLAREEGFEVILGDAASVATLKRAKLNDASAFVITIPSDDRALLTAQIAKSQFRCERIISRVDEATNFGIFEAAGVLVVNPNEALAAEFVGVLTGAPKLDAFAIPEEDMEAVRITLTNPDARSTLEMFKPLRGTIVVLIRREGRRIMPNGKTRLELGDQLTVFGPSAAVAQARRALTLEGSQDED